MAILLRAARLLSRGRIWSGVCAVGYVCLLGLLTLVSCTGCDLFSDEPQDDLTLAWHIARPRPGLQPPTPAIADGSAFVPMGSEIHRIDLRSGEVRWRVPLGNVDELNGHLHTDEATVYAYEIGEWLRAYAIDDGQLLWHTSLSDARGSSFSDLVDGADYFYVPLADSIVKVRKTDGALSTLAHLPAEEVGGVGQIAHYAALDAEGTLCVSADYPSPPGDYPDLPRQGLIYNIDAATGQIRWTYHLPRIEQDEIVFYQEANACVVVDDLVVVVASGRIMGLREATGEVVWDQVFNVPFAEDRDGFAPGPATTDGTRLFVGSAREKLYALDITTGEVEWATMTRGSFGKDLPVIQGDRVYIANPSFGELWAMDRRTGEVRAHIEPPPELDDNFFSWVAIGEGYLVVLGFRQVYAYKL